MDWKTIYDTIYEIQNLQEECQLKIKNPIITSISKRYLKYFDKEISSNTNQLNNAVLENKIKNTKLQREILIKINDLLLPATIDDIYHNLSYDEKECSQYVNDIKQKFELANKCLDLVIELETLSETEYKSEEPFPESEYAKMISHQNQLYFSILDNPKLFNQPYIEENISNYYESLSLDKKQKLYLESLALSYERNVFNYLNLIKMSYSSQNHFPNENIYGSAVVYKYYQKFVIDSIMYRYIYSKNISEVYQELNELHTSLIIKQNIKKK